MSSTLSGSASGTVAEAAGEGAVSRGAGDADFLQRLAARGELEKHGGRNVESFAQFLTTILV
jgi:hypothetical protein